MVTTSEASKAKPANEALADSGLPISSATLRRHLRAGRIEAQLIGTRWFTTAVAIRAALVSEVRP